LIRVYLRRRSGFLQANEPIRKAIFFLGAGRVTSALAGGLRLAGYKRPLIAYDRHPEKLRALKRESRVEISRDLKSGLERADILIVAVRPASVKEILSEIAACPAKPPRLCISLAAGIPLKNLRRWLNAVHWVRAMPSPVCRICRGLTPVAFDRSVTKSERAQVRKLFERVGPAPVIPERQMDIITATHSPTYGYHALAALAKAAAKAGLNRDTALIAAAHALSDGVTYWRESGLNLDELLHEAATPGGIAAATMNAMDRSGYSRAVQNGLKAGIRRARQNARL
jgi:pyrroline-5-carboxylate reductase